MFTKGQVSGYETFHFTDEDVKKTFAQMHIEMVEDYYGVSVDVSDYNKLYSILHLLKLHARKFCVTDEEFTELGFFVESNK